MVENRKRRLRWRSDDERRAVCEQESREPSTLCRDLGARRLEGCAVEAMGCQSQGLRRAAVPNVWHQRRAQRVRCMPGLGNGEDAEMKKARRMMVPAERAMRCDCDGRLPALLDDPVPSGTG